MSKDMQCIIIIIALCLFIVIHVARSKPKKRKPKQHVYDKTIYKPRKPENKGLPEGDFTHEHIESMWDEIK